MKKINKKGSTLLFAILISTIVLVIGLALTEIIIAEIKMGKNIENTQNAYYNTESGLELALLKDYQGGGLTGDIQSNLFCIDGNNCYTYEKDLMTGIITAKGLSWGVSRMIIAIGKILDGTTNIASGYGHSLALVKDGTVWAWGDGQYGQLGDNRSGAGIKSLLLIKVRNKDNNGDLNNIKSVASGKIFSIALSNDGTVWSWGYNGSRQLGDGTVTQRQLPVKVLIDVATNAALSNIKSVSTGMDHSLALKNDGTVWAWGSNSANMLGNTNAGGASSIAIPVLRDGSTSGDYLNNVKMVSAGANFSSALKNDGTVWAWGWNNFGQLGDGSTTNRSAPTKVTDSSGSDLTGIIVINSKYANHSLALKNDGTVWAWGYNDKGQIGDGTTGTNRTRAVKVKDSTNADLSNVKSITVGDSHSLALKNDGTVWAWGYNHFGQLGDGSWGLDGTPDDKNKAIQVKSSDGLSFLSNIESITAGSMYSFARSINGSSFWSWGQNLYGQLGDNTLNPSSLPVQVKGPGGSGYLSDG